MLRTLTQLKRKPWAPLQRRAWLAEKRRERHLLPAPMLRPAFPDLLVWNWDLPNPYKWNVWQSLNGGASYFLAAGYWMYGDARQFAPDGGGELHFIVGVDENGNEITQRSNSVRPDDAVSPNAPAILNGRFEWDFTTTGYADVFLDFEFQDANFPAAQLEVHMSLNGGAFGLLATVGSASTSYAYPEACAGECNFDFKLRYVNGSVVGPFSNVYRVTVTT